MLINTEEQLIQGILKHGPDILDQCLVDLKNPSFLKYLERVSTEKLNYPSLLGDVPTTRNWFIPNDYLSMDIETFLIEKCPKENYDRLTSELELFKKHNMLDVLIVMKFVVDTLRKNDIVWGVGRGSSVASYALYLIGVHRIDSVKYNLPIDEFFKGENNGISSKE